MTCHKYCLIWLVLSRFEMSIVPPIRCIFRHSPHCLQPPHARNMKNLFGVHNIRYAFDLIPVVSSSFHPCPLCTLSIFFNLSKFSPVSECSSVFQKVFQKVFDKAMRSVSIVSRCTREVFIGYRFFLLLFHFLFAYL